MAMAYAMAYALVGLRQSYGDSESEVHRSAPIVFARQSSGHIHARLTGA